MNFPINRHKYTATLAIFAKFWTPHFSFLDSTLFRLDSTFWLDSTLKLNYDMQKKFNGKLAMFK